MIQDVIFHLLHFPKRLFLPLSKKKTGDLPQKYIYVDQVQKKQARDLSPSLGGDLVRDLLLFFCT